MDMSHQQTQKTSRKAKPAYKYLLKTRKKKEKANPQKGNQSREAPKECKYTSEDRSTKGTNQVASMQDDTQINKSRGARKKKARETIHTHMPGAQKSTHKRRHPRKHKEPSKATSKKKPAHTQHTHKSSKLVSKNVHARKLRYTSSAVS